MAVARLAWNMATHGFRSTHRDFTLRGAPGRQAGRKAEEPKTTRRRLTAYSPAVALSAALVLLWVFGPDLHLRPRTHVAAATQTAQR
jgi:hypothetical protein